MPSFAVMLMPESSDDLALRPVSVVRWSAFIVIRDHKLRKRHCLSLLKLVAK